MHYVLRKKLKNNTATGLDGWRPHELKNLPDCLLLALLDIFHLCEKVGRFPSSFYYSYTTLIPKGVARTPLSLRPITVLPVPYRLYVVYVGKHCSIGKILGYILHSLLSVKDVVLLVSTVTFLLICCRDIRHMAALLASSLTLLSVLILSLIPLFGLPLNIMVAIPLLLTFFLIYIQISHAVSVMQDVSAPFGTLPTGYYKEILFVLLFLTVSSALWLLACQPWETWPFMLLLMILLSFLLLGTPLLLPTMYFASLALPPISALTSVNVNSGIREILMVTTLLTLISLLSVFTPSCLEHPLMSASLTTFLYLAPTKLFFFVRRRLLNYHFLMSSLIACLLLLCHLVIIILLSLVIWAPRKMFLLNMPLPLSLFLSVVNGSVEKLYLPLLHRVISYPPTSFSTTAMLLSTFCTLSTPVHNNAPTSRNYGMTLHTWNGVPFFACVLLLNILGFSLKTLLFLLFMKLLILLMVIFLPLNISSVIHIDNSILLKPHNADKTG